MNCVSRIVLPTIFIFKLTSCTLCHIHYEVFIFGSLDFSYISGGRGESSGTSIILLVLLFFFFVFL